MQPGGGVDYGEDFLGRIVGVHWRKPEVETGMPLATFVFGGFGSDFFGTGGVLTVKVNPVKAKQAEGGDQDAKHELEKSIVKIPLDVNFEPIASSYAVVERMDPVTRTKRLLPTFLVAGNQANVFTNIGGGQSAKVNAQIYCSSDGLSWSKVFDQPPTMLDDFGGGFYGNPLGLVWDPDSKAFYFDVLTFTGPIEAAIISDTIFRSADGFSWSEILRTTTGGSSGYVSPFPSSYCKHNDCIDALGNHVPDGVMKQDPIAKISMQPVLPPTISYGEGAISFDFSSGGETYGGPSVKIDAESEHFTKSMPGIAKVFCVAGVFGIWMAGGSGDPAGDSGALAISIDQGKTWTPFTPPQGAILTMVAGAYGGSLASDQRPGIIP